MNETLENPTKVRTPVDQARRTGYWVGIGFGWVIQTFLMFCFAHGTDHYLEASLSSLPMALAGAVASITLFRCLFAWMQEVLEELRRR